MSILIATQALGEKAALDGFWYGVGQSLYGVLDFVEANPYPLIGVLIVVAYFALRKR